MFGFLIGTACLIGLIATLRRGYGGGCGYGYASRGCGSRGYGRSGGHHAYRGECHDESSYGGSDYSGHCGPSEHREHRRGGRGFRGFGPRAWVAMLSHRLDLTPAQEKVVGQAFGEIRDSIRKGRGELRDSRREVAKAFRATSFDAVLLGETFARHDNTIEDVRKAVTGALARVHEALDERQREKVAEILEEGWW